MSSVIVTVVVPSSLNKSSRLLEDRKSDRNYPALPYNSRVVVVVVVVVVIKFLWYQWPLRAEHTSGLATRVRQTIPLVHIWL